MENDLFNELRKYKKLQTKAGGGRINKMYYNKAAGTTFHIGYVVGKRWFTMYEPIEILSA